MTTLNLGAGNAPIDGAVNHDIIKHRPEIDVVHDLNLLPWPWPDESFTTIVAKAVLEHLEHTLILSLNECWRLLRKEGHLYLKLPYWKCEISYTDPTHRWFFNLNSCDMFDPDTRYGQQYAFYTPRKWRIVHPPKLNKAQSSIHWTLQVRK